MDIQIFLGVPNCEIRRAWIQRKFIEYMNSKEDELFYAYQEESENLVPKWVHMAVNFTADAMKKV